MASIYENLRNEGNFLHKKRVQLPQAFFGTPIWPPFHCFGTSIWPPWRLIWVRSIWRIVGPRLGGLGWLYHHKKAGDLARRSLFLPSQLFVTHVTDSSPKGNPKAVFKLYHNPLLFTCVSESSYESSRNGNFNQIWDGLSYRFQMFRVWPVVHRTR